MIGRSGVILKIICRDQVVSAKDNEHLFRLLFLAGVKLLDEKSVPYTSVNGLQNMNIVP